MRRPPIVLIALALSRPLLAQAPLAFDAATVRINHTPPEVIYTRTEPGGRFVASGASLRLLIMTAYAGQTAPRIVGGPNWIDSVQFDISARSEGATPAQTRTMLRTLLADRFKLAVHTETQQLPVYELVVAKSDGRPGSGLRASTASCPPPAPQPGSGPPPPPPTSASGVRLCGIGGRSGQLAGVGATPAQLASALSSRVDRPVFDRTGLTGRIDVDLRWTPDVAAPSPNGDAAATTGAPIFTAIEEQLGLKLNAARGPVDALVIDRVEKPSED